MSHWITIIFVIMICPLFLSGCWDRLEVNDLAIVVASSVDKEEGGLYRYSVQVPLVGQLGGGTMGSGSGGGGGTAFYVDSETGKTIREAVQRLQLRMSRQLIFSHRRILIVGEDMARQGIQDLFDEIARLPDNRLTTYMIISKGKAVDLLKAKPKFERFSGEAIREIAQGPQILLINLKDIAQALNQKGADPLVPYMEINESKRKSKDKEIQFVGYAQFKGDKLVGVYKDKAVIGMHWLWTRFRPYLTTFEMGEKGKEKPITINVFDGKRTIHPRIQDGKLQFDLKVAAKGAVQESMIAINLQDKENQKKLEKQFREDIQKSIEAFIKQSQDRQTDSGQLGLLISREYPKEWRETVSKQWEEMVSKAQFHIDVDAKITRLGQITENISKGDRQ